MNTEIPFTKYQGTGNDFILIDQRGEKNNFALEEDIIKKLCNRRFGIGADGLMLLQDSSTTDFRMVYYNSDGRPSSMCGNGGRCIVHFAKQLGVFQEKTIFEAVDGIHKAEILGPNVVMLEMRNVNKIITIDTDTYELNTGSPHYVSIVKILPYDCKSAGSAIRNSDKYKNDGINVNFISISENEIEICTYERGVEDETLSCGTGVTAAAIIAHFVYNLSSPIKVNTKGGQLEVSFEIEKESYKNIWLTGGAEESFSGIFSI